MFACLCGERHTDRETMLKHYCIKDYLSEEVIEAIRRGDRMHDGMKLAIIPKPVDTEKSQTSPSGAATNQPKSGSGSGSKTVSKDKDTK